MCWTFGTKYKIFLFNSISRVILILQFLQFTDNLCSWSDWSDCSASCGTGFKIRQKTIPGNHGADVRNLEISECQRRKQTEKRTCLLPPCQGIFLNYLVKNIFIHGHRCSKVFIKFFWGGICGCEKILGPLFLRCIAFLWPSFLEIFDSINGAPCPSLPFAHMCLRSEHLMFPWPHLLLN